MSVTPSAQRLLLLINPQSGPGDVSSDVERAVRETWSGSGTEITCMVSEDREDGCAKARAAVTAGVDVILAAGGDGMANSLADVLLHETTVLGIIPTGSGNGFARHFGIPLKPNNASRALCHGEVRSIDVPTVNGRPFVVTCSLAWEAAIVEWFERFPVRGMLPYLLSGVVSALEYEPQATTIETADRQSFYFKAPVVMTFANLSQYGGGFVIAPNASPSDGKVELAVVERRRVPELLLQLPRLFDREINELSAVFCTSGAGFVVRREKSSQIQVDGELVNAGATLSVEVLPKALRVLVPRAQESQQ